MAVNPYAVLEKRIRTGEYRSGDWLASERTLAVELGVNRRTVHRAVERLAEAGLLLCQPGRRPIIKGPSPGASHPPCIALLMGNEPQYHAFQEVLHGCEPVLRAAGYRIVFMDTWGRTVPVGQEREQEALDSLIQHPVQGAIVWSQAPPQSAARLALLRERGMPSVIIDREVPSLHADFVGIDNPEAARTAVEHLISLGHRRIAFAMGQETTSPVRDREAGYRDTLKGHGIPVDESLICRFESIEAEPVARAQAAALARRKDRPTAIFAVNDLLALRLRRYLLDEGIRIPDDIAVAGFDDLEALSLMQTGLTTISQPYEAMGRQAARLIVRRIDQPDAPIQHVVLPTRLVVRASTAGEAAPGVAASRPQQGESTAIART